MNLTIIFKKWLVYNVGNDVTKNVELIASKISILHILDIIEYKQLYMYSACTGIQEEWFVIL